MADFSVSQRVCSSLEPSFKSASSLSRRARRSLEALSFSFFKALCSIEGIVPALETAHGIAYVIKRARELADNQIIVGNLSGRGDKDVREVARVLGDL